MSNEKGVQPPRRKHKGLRKVRPLSEITNVIHDEQTKD